MSFFCSFDSSRIGSLSANRVRPPAAAPLFAHFQRRNLIAAPDEAGEGARLGKAAPLRNLADRQTRPPQQRDAVRHAVIHDVAPRRAPHLFGKHLGQRRPRHLELVAEHPDPELRIRQIRHDELNAALRQHFRTQPAGNPAAGMRQRLEDKRRHPADLQRIGVPDVALKLRKKPLRIRGTRMLMPRVAVGEHDRLGQRPVEAEPAQIPAVAK